MKKGERVNKKAITNQILDLIATSESEHKRDQDAYTAKNLRQLTENLNRVTHAFSGSWHGYHANVYYEGLVPPPPGNSFSPEWGLMDPFGNGTHGWKEYSYEEVEKAILESVDDDFEFRFSEASEQAKTIFHDTHSSLVTIIAVLLEGKKTQMLEEIQRQASEIEMPLPKSELISRMSPKGQFVSRDMAAISQGTKIPPHIDVKTKFLSLRSPFSSLKHINQVARRLFKYMEMQDLTDIDSSRFGTKVFIGHGRSHVWQQVQDFIEHRLQLPWDEFNRVSTAGFATVERLNEMLDDACFALLVMTAEEESGDGTMHARENVIHEVGLFQGRIGFRRAIVLLEEGCAEFSNIHGLVQLRFPKGSVSATFEEIRRVLEREGILTIK